MLRQLSKYSGVIIGAGYGLLLRLLMSAKFQPGFSFTDLFSVTFIWIVPVLIGVMPMLFATQEQLRSKSYRCITPLLTVLLFFIFCFITRIEDLLCIFIISIPFLVGSMIGGLVFGWLILSYKDRKGTLLSVLLIPFIAGAIEENFKIPSGVYEVKTVTLINNTPDKIWQNIIRVRNIGDNEFSKGVFNFAGIPRPLYAELDQDTIGAMRIGHFEGGLKFKETVNTWEPGKKISFDIKVVAPSIRQTVFDKHVLMGNHFRFLNATYQLTKINDRQTLLALSSTYRLDTRINYYASFWGDIMLSDFQQRLLNVIKKRCDKK